MTNGDVVSNGDVGIVLSNAACVGADGAAILNVAIAADRNSAVISTDD